MHILLPNKCLASAQKRVSAYKYINILYFLINQLNASVFYTQLTYIVHWDPVIIILFPEFLSNTIYRCGTVGFGVFLFGFSVSLLLIITTLVSVISINSVLSLSRPPIPVPNCPWLASLGAQALLTHWGWTLGWSLAGPQRTLWAKCPDWFKVMLVRPVIAGSSALPRPRPPHPLLLLSRQMSSTQSNSSAVCVLKRVWWRIVKLQQPPIPPTPPPTSYGSLCCKSWSFVGFSLCSLTQPQCPPMFLS